MHARPLRLREPCVLVPPVRRPDPTSPDEHVIVLDPGHRRRREGIACHVAVDPDVVTVRGRQVLERLAGSTELAASLDLVDLVVVGHHLVRRGLVTIMELRDLVAVYAGTHGASRAPRRVVRASRVDSPMESRLRMLLVLARHPGTEDQPHDPRRGRRADPQVRPELAGRQVIVEYDGRHHVLREETWERDLDRREWIDRRRLALWSW